MSFFSIGKNELKKLQEDEQLLKTQIEKTQDSYTQGKNVYSFSKLVLQNRQNKLKAKISLLQHMNPDNSDGIA